MMGRGGPSGSGWAYPYQPQQQSQQQQQFQPPQQQQLPQQQQPKRKKWDAKESLPAEEQKRWNERSLLAGYSDCGGRLSSCYSTPCADGRWLDIIQRLDGEWVVKNDTMDEVVTRWDVPDGVAPEAWNGTFKVIDDMMTVWDEWEASIRKDERGEDGDGNTLYVRTGIRGDLEGANVDDFYISGNGYVPEQRPSPSPTLNSSGGIGVGS